MAAAHSPQPTEEAPSAAGQGRARERRRALDKAAAGRNVSEDGATLRADPAALRQYIMFLPMATKPEFLLLLYHNDRLAWDALRLAESDLFSCVSPDPRRRTRAGVGDGEGAGRRVASSEAALRGRPFESDRRRKRLSYEGSLLTRISVERGCGHLAGIRLGEGTH